MITSERDGLPLARSTSVGLISDTHGLLRPEALAALRSCHRIIHAGDLGKAGIFEALSALAPAVAVRGNVDRDCWAEKFPESLTVSIEGVAVHVLHELPALSFDPRKKGVQIVVSGHSHHPVIEEDSGVLYVNPGSAGPRRFLLPVTVARLRISPTEIQIEIIDILSNMSVAMLTVPRAVSA